MDIGLSREAWQKTKKMKTRVVTEAHSRLSSNEKEKDYKYKGLRSYFQYIYYTCMTDFYNRHDKIIMSVKVFETIYTCMVCS